LVACGLLFSSSDTAPTQVTASITQLTTTSKNPDYFRMATGNVYGTVQFQEASEAKDLLLEVSNEKRLVVTPPANNTFNLSELLELYGDAYEIEFENNGVLKAKGFDPSEANRMLIYLVIFFGGLYVSHTRA
jgi:hypothetical protein